MGEGARSQGFADSFRLAGTVFFVELGGVDPTVIRGGNAVKEGRAVGGRQR